MNRKNIVSFTQRAVQGVRNAGGKIAAGTTALVASGSALATTQGAAIAGELADGKSQMGLVFAAVAVLIGALLVWNYIRRSAR